MKDEEDYQKLNQLEVAEPKLVERPEYHLESLRDSVPPEMRTNFILAGYRPIGQSLSFYLFGLFRWHNETLPIWSHMLAFVLWVFVYVNWIVQGAPHSAHVDEVLGRAAIFWMHAHQLCLGAVFLASSLFHLLNSMSPFARFCWELVDVSTVVTVAFLCTSQMILQMPWPVLLRLSCTIMCWVLSAVVLGRLFWLMFNDQEFEAYCEAVTAGNKAVAFVLLARPLSLFLIAAAVLACVCLFTSQGLVQGLLPNGLAVLSLVVYWLQWPDSQPWFQKKTNGAIQASHTVFHVGVAIWAFGCFSTCS